MTATTNPPATSVTDRRRAPATKPAKALDMDLLSFVNVGIEQGQLRIEAEYPSASEPGRLHSIIVRGDGTVAYHRCRASGPCYHVADPDAIVTEYHLRQYRLATDEQLRADDHWYKTRVDSLDREGLLQWHACGIVIGERLERAAGGQVA